MKKIELTQGYVTLVDDEDFNSLNQFKWQVHFDGYNYYARRFSYKPKKETIIMHRVIMNTPQDLVVDHIDHNGLNNQKSNLRNCTRPQNLMNTKVHGKSKYIGVTIVPAKNRPFKDKKTGKIRYYDCKQKYISQIHHNKIKYHLGCFTNEIDAAYAYDKKAKELHGEFASLNFK
jgi:hypothetical protein